METPLLDECLYLLSLSVDEENEDAFDRMTDPDLNIYDKFSIPLTKEINHLLLGNETKNGKRDMIKYFINQFVEPSLMFRRYNELFDYSCSGSGLQWKLKSRDGKTILDADPMECYILCSIELYEMIFHIFQNCCITYDIGFYKLLKDLAFSSDHIEGSMIVTHESEKFRQLYGAEYEEDDHNLSRSAKDIIPEKSLKISKEDLIKSLKEYGFFELPLITKFKSVNIPLLMEQLFVNETPYKIAMLDYLGFLKKLRKEHFNTQKELCNYLSICLGTSPRTISGNIHVLEDYSKENKGRFTAYKFKQEVIKDYQRLK